MKLYIGLTAYHLLSACTIVKKSDEKNSELLIEGVTEQEPELVKNIRESDIFNNVYYVNQTEAWQEINKLDMNADAEKIDEAVKSVVEFWTSHFVYFKNIIRRYDQIIIWDDHFTLGMALAFLKIPYCYYEESPGCNYRREVFIDLSINQITNKAFAPVVLRYGLRGKYPYAVSNNYDFDLNPMDRREQDLDFSLVKSLKDLKTFNLEGFYKIKQIFAPDGYFIKEQNDISGRENFLLMGQHYSDSLYKNINMIRYVLFMLVDYFGEDMNLWIKNHPSNYFNPMQAWFPDANVVNEKVPIELLCVENVVKFHRVAAVSSSAPLAMYDNDTEIILFQNAANGDSFESKKKFMDLHKYFVVAKIIEGIWCKHDIQEMCIVGIETLSWKYINKYQNINLPPMRYISNLSEATGEKISCLIDCRELQGECDLLEWLIQLNEHDLVFLIGIDEINLFENVGFCDIIDNIFPIPIDIIDRLGNSGFFGAGTPEPPLKNMQEKLHRESYNEFRNIERQIVYMYTKSIEIVNSVLTQSIEKKLERCGLDVVYKPFEFNYREIVFESMLEQLEHQYVKLQCENIKLHEQIQEYENLEEKLNKESNMMSNNNTEAINATLTMLVNQMTAINTQIIKFHSWYGLKLRIKEKWRKIIQRKQKDV